MEKERGVEIGRRLAGLHCRLRVMLDRGWETTEMVLKHVIELEGQRIAKESVWGKIEIILKCVARCRCSGKVAQAKVVGLYPHLSSHEEAERFHRRFRVSARTSKRIEWKQLWPASDLPSQYTNRVLIARDETNTLPKEQWRRKWL